MTIRMADKNLYKSQCLRRYLVTRSIRPRGSWHSDATYFILSSFRIAQPITVDDIYCILYDFDHNLSRPVSVLHVPKQVKRHPLSRAR
jgi:hypothetical protein